MPIHNLSELLAKNLVIVDAIAKIDSIMQEYAGKTIYVAYSGGSDSDIVLHLLRLAGYEVPAVIYDTGLEYQATWDHVEYMRSLGFQIEKIKAKRPVPTSNKIYGHPFVSKRVSDMLERLQQHHFDFQVDGPKSFDELYQKFPRCKAVLRWWCNDFPDVRTNISQNKHLKEFLIEYGLPFKVSGKCCDGAKKMPIKDFAKDKAIDLMLLGLRKAEGGARMTAYKSCVLPKGKYSYAMFLPIFWWKQEDKRLFEMVMKIQHSACYSTYGLARTGCAGCPFGRNFEEELVAIDQYESKLSKGIRSIFDRSYEWTRLYREFQKTMNCEAKEVNDVEE